MRVRLPYTRTQTGYTYRITVMIERAKKSTNLDSNTRALTTPRSPPRRGQIIAHRTALQTPSLHRTTPPHGVIHIQIARVRASASSPPLPPFGAADTSTLRSCELKMVKLTMIARVTDGLPLAEGLDDGRDSNDAEFYKQQVKALFKNLSRGQNEASRMSIETEVSEMSSRLTSESRIYADKARDLNRQALIRKWAPVAIVLGVVFLLFWVKTKIW
ncbi:hypothetical protein FH972_003504 [Carpinus fangiana]|uniref:V-SNARE coiled-coil homology domain-containing protein n=1 Tax=Carpinus fangiana TaxID=176857 RepID=A0A5N6QIM9_9ROSI|nr:hypothetical protein FH972_003504 [Carpinus fangiana]